MGESDEHTAPARSVVLVHGAFTDGTCWRRVIPMVKKAGLNVVSVQLPLDSLERDTSFVERALNLAEPPVVLVGHDWGGMVITEVGLHPKVKSLVYVAAFIPDVGESLVDMSRCDPQSPILTCLQSDDRGYVKLSDEGVRKHLAPDLPRSEQEIIAATQSAIASTAFVESVHNAAWRRRRSFALLATCDSFVSPEVQRSHAQRAGASIYEVASSHLVALSHPEAVARVILEAIR